MKRSKSPSTSSVQPHYPRLAIGICETNVWLFTTILIDHKNMEQYRKTTTTTTAATSASNDGDYGSVDVDQNNNININNNNINNINNNINNIPLGLSSSGDTETTVVASFFIKDDGTICRRYEQCFERNNHVDIFDNINNNNNNINNRSQAPPLPFFSFNEAKQSQPFSFFEVYDTLFGSVFLDRLYLLVGEVTEGIARVPVAPTRGQLHVTKKPGRNQSDKKYSNNNNNNLNNNNNNNKLESQSNYVYSTFIGPTSPLSTTSSSIRRVISAVWVGIPLMNIPPPYATKSEQTRLEEFCMIENNAFQKQTIGKREKKELAAGLNNINNNNNNAQNNTVTDDFIGGSFDETKTQLNDIPTNLGAPQSTGDNSTKKCVFIPMRNSSCVISPSGLLSSSDGFDLQEGNRNKSQQQQQHHHQIREPSSDLKNTDGSSYYGSTIQNNHSNNTSTSRGQSLSSPVNKETPTLYVTFNKSHYINNGTFYYCDDLDVRKPFPFCGAMQAQAQAVGPLGDRDVVNNNNNNNNNTNPVISSIDNKDVQEPIYECDWNSAMRVPWLLSLHGVGRGSLDDIANKVCAGEYIRTSTIGGQEGSFYSRNENNNKKKKLFNQIGDRNIIGPCSTLLRGFCGSAVLPLDIPKIKKRGTVLMENILSETSALMCVSSGTEGKEVIVGEDTPRGLQKRYERVRMDNNIQEGNEDNKTDDMCDTDKGYSSVSSLASTYSDMEDNNENPPIATHSNHSGINHPHNYAASPLFTNSKEHIHLLIIGRQNNLNPGPRYYSRGLNCINAAGNDHVYEIVMWRLTEDYSKNIKGQDITTTTTIETEPAVEMCQTSLTTVTSTDSTNLTNNTNNTLMSFDDIFLSGPSTPGVSSKQSEIYNIDKWQSPGKLEGVMAACPLPLQAGCIQGDQVLKGTYTHIPQYRYIFARHTILRGTAPVNWSSELPAGGWGLSDVRMIFNPDPSEVMKGTTEYFTGILSKLDNLIKYDCGGESGDIGKDLSENNNNNSSLRCISMLRHSPECGSKGEEILARHFNEAVIQANYEIGIREVKERCSTERGSKEDKNNSDSLIYASKPLQHRIDVAHVDWLNIQKNAGTEKAVDEFYRNIIPFLMADTIDSGTEGSIGNRTFIELVNDMAEEILVQQLEEEIFSLDQNMTRIGDNGAVKQALESNPTVVKSNNDFLDNFFADAETVKSNHSQETLKVAKTSILPNSDNSQRSPEEIKKLEDLREIHSLLSRRIVERQKGSKGPHKGNIVTMGFLKTHPTSVRRSAQSTTYTTDYITTDYVQKRFIRINCADSLDRTNMGCFLVIQQMALEMMRLLGLLSDELTLLGGIAAGEVTSDNRRTNWPNIDAIISGLNEGSSNNNKDSQLMNFFSTNQNVSNKSPTQTRTTSKNVKDQMISLHGYDRQQNNKCVSAGSEILCDNTPQLQLSPPNTDITTVVNDSLDSFFGETIDVSNNTRQDINKSPVILPKVFTSDGTLLTQRSKSPFNQPLSPEDDKSTSMDSFSYISVITTKYRWPLMNGLNNLLQSAVMADRTLRFNKNHSSRKGNLYLMRTSDSGGVGRIPSPATDLFVINKPSSGYSFSMSAEDYGNCLSQNTPTDSPLYRPSTTNYYYYSGVRCPYSLIRALAFLMVENGDCIAQSYTNSQAMHTHLLRGLGGMKPPSSNTVIIAKRRFENMFEDKKKYRFIETILGRNLEVHFPSYCTGPFSVMKQVQPCWSWTILINNVPNNATHKDLERAFRETWDVRVRSIASSYKIPQSDVALSNMRIFIAPSAENHLRVRIYLQRNKREKLQSKNNSLHLSNSPDLSNVSTAGDSVANQQVSSLSFPSRTISVIPLESAVCTSPPSAHHYTAAASFHYYSNTSLEDRRNINGELNVVNPLLQLGFIEVSVPADGSVFLGDYDTEIDEGNSKTNNNNNRKNTVFKKHLCELKPYDYKINVASHGDSGDGSYYGKAIVKDITSSASKAVSGLKRGLKSLVRQM